MSLFCDLSDDSDLTDPVLLSSSKSEIETLLELLELLLEVELLLENLEDLDEVLVLDFDLVFRELLELLDL